MAKDAWIDSDTYAGHERRAGGSGMRIFDRRKQAGSWAKAPSLPTIIRQLKSASLGLHGEAQWARFRVRLDGAIGLADMQGHQPCVEELSALRAAIIRAGNGLRLPPSHVEAYLDRAAHHCEGW